MYMGSAYTGESSLPHLKSVNKGFWSDYGAHDKTQLH